MRPTFQRPFAMSLMLLERERGYGSSRFRLDLDVVRFDEQLRFSASIWLENDAWDGFVSSLIRPEAGEAVLHDMSDEFRFRFNQGSDPAYVGIEVAARHFATPDVSLCVRADDVGRDTMESIRRTFLECQPWWK